MKKNFLAIVAITSFFSSMEIKAISINDISNSDTNLAIAGASGLVLGGAITASCMHAYYRESNAVKIEKINRIWRHAVDTVASNPPQNFSKLAPLFKKFDIFVYELQNDLQGRYGSWKTPWNWLPSMKLACKKAAILQILFRYLDVLYYWHPAISNDSIEKLAINICDGTYSVTRFVQILDKDMHVIEVAMNDAYCPFGNILYDHLRAVKEIAMQSHAYKLENPRPINQV